MGWAKSLTLQPLHPKERVPAFLQQKAGLAPWLTRFFTEAINALFLPGIEPRFVLHPASSLVTITNTANSRSNTWGLQVVRYPNFFLGNGSR